MLQQKAAELLSAGDIDAWERVNRELRLAERERDVAWSRLAAARSEGAVPKMPAQSGREQVHAVLDRAHLPLAPQQIAALSSALYQEEISYKALTSVRHDERRAYSARPAARTFYICPALHHDTLAPARGLLTVSTWPLADRIIAPLTPRTIHLRLTLLVADAVEAARIAPAADAEPPVVLERLLWRLAATIPGVARGEFDTGRIRRGATEELALLAGRDAADRVQAADRAAAMSPEAQLFGVLRRDVNASRRRAGGAAEA